MSVCNLNTKQKFNLTFILTLPPLYQSCYTPLYIHYGNQSRNGTPSFFFKEAIGGYIMHAPRQSRQAKKKEMIKKKLLVILQNQTKNPVMQSPNVSTIFDSLTLYLGVQRLKQQQQALSWRYILLPIQLACRIYIYVCSQEPLSFLSNPPPPYLLIEQHWSRVVVDPHPSIRPSIRPAFLSHGSTSRQSRFTSGIIAASAFPSTESTPPINFPYQFPPPLFFFVFCFFFSFFFFCVFLISFRKCQGFQRKRIKIVK